MMPLPARVWTSGSVLLPAFAALLVTLSCSQLVYQPGAVVPTASPLPYSAMVRLIDELRTGESHQQRRERR